MKKEKEVVRSKNCYGKNGISLISLIITIIVIIILAAIVIFSGLNTPDRANLAKFTQSFSDYNTAIMSDYTKKKTQYAVGGQSRTDAQIYYIIATGNENIVDVNDAPTPVATIEKLGLNLHPEQLAGTEYYEITSDSNIEGINKQMQFYEVGEKHYVTDAGEAFTLPGYLVAENGTNRWYINEKKYYESDEPIEGPFSFDVSEWKLLSEDDDNSEEVQGKLGKGVDTAYIYFTATANGQPATISYTPSNEENTTSDTGKILLPISDNGEYNFTITATVDGTKKTTTKKVTISNTFLEMTPVSAFKTRGVSGGVEIIGLNDTTLRVINIPSKIGKYPVIRVSGLCYNGNITSVTIPSSVTSIGTFYYCRNLVSVDIPSSVTSIENGAFSGCSSLTSIKIPSGVTSIEVNTFNNCSSLTSIEIPSSVTSIGISAFQGCSSLTSIEIPSSVTSIGTAAFKGCSSLTNNIAIPSSVTSIGQSAFQGCSSLTSIEIPSSVTSIGQSAFQGCSSLKNITIPSEVISIGSSAFYNCTSLESATIPTSVTSIPNMAFYHCSSLQDIYYAGTQAQWNSISKGSNNEGLTNAKIHCSDGDINS